MLSRSSRRARLALQPLEDRCIPAITTAVAAGVLTVTGDTADDTIVFSESGGNIQINGGNPGSGPAASSSITTIQIDSGGGADNIDLSGLVAASLTALTKLSADAGAGEDVILYSNTFSSSVGIAFVGGTGNDILNLTGTATVVTHNQATGKVSLDAQVISQDLEAVFDSLTATQRLFVASGQRTISTGATESDQLTRFTDTGDATRFVEFPMPSDRLEFTFGTADDTLTFNGFDKASKLPAITKFDGGDGVDTLRMNQAFLGGDTAGLVTYNQTDDTITIGDNSVRQAFEQIFDAIKAVDRTFTSAGSETIDAGASLSDGLSRVFATNQPTVFVEFVAPTGMLQFNYAAGNDNVIYRGLDTTGPLPASVTIDTGTGTDLLRIESVGKALPTSLVYTFEPNGDAASYILALTDTTLRIHNTEQVTDLLTPVDRKFLLLDVATTGGGGASLSAGATENDGLSRLTRVANNAIDNSISIDFATPTRSLTIDGRAGDDLLIYNGIDTKVMPTTIFFDGGAGKDTFRLVGSAQKVINSFAASPLTSEIDGRLVTYDAEVLNDLIVATERTFRIRSGSSEILTDNDTPNDGISRLSNPTLGLSTEFANPSQILTIIGGEQAVTITVRAVDTKGAPPTIALEGSNRNDTFVVVPLVSSNYVIDGGSPIAAPGDTLSILLEGAQGVMQGNNQFTFANRKSITYQSIETFTVSTTPPDPVTPPTPPVSPPPPLLPPTNGLTPPAVNFRVNQSETSFFVAINGTAVILYNNETRLFPINAFTSVESPFGVQAAVADVTGDLIPEIIVGTGPNVQSRIRVIDGITQAVIREIVPFEGVFGGGLFLAAGDLNADGIADIVVTPDAGGGGRVTVYDGRTGAVIADFFGIEDIDFRGGARATVGDLNGDNLPDLIIAAGRGGGPRIAIYDGRFVTVVAVGTIPPKLLPDFFIFEPSQRDGAYVSSIDLNGDGFDDLIASGGPGGGPRVFALSGGALSKGAVIPLVNFFAFDSNTRNGVRITAKDFNQDGLGDLVVAGPNEIKLYDGGDLIRNGNDPDVRRSFSPFGSSPFFTGIFVG